MVIERVETETGTQWRVPQWFVTTITAVALMWVAWVSGGVSYSLNQLTKGNRFTAAQGAEIRGIVNQNEREIAEVKAQIATKDWLEEKFNSLEKRIDKLEAH